MTADEIRIAEEIRKAGKAAEVLKNEAFRDAVRIIEEALLTGMRNAAIADDKLRLRLLDKYEALYDLLDQLQSAMNTGAMAEQELKTLKQRVKEFFN